MDKDIALREFAIQAAYKGIDLEKTFDAISELLKPVEDLACKNEEYLRRIMGGNPD